MTLKNRIVKSAAGSEMQDNTVWPSDAALAAACLAMEQALDAEGVASPPAREKDLLQYAAEEGQSCCKGGNV